MENGSIAPVGVLNLREKPFWTMYLGSSAFVFALVPLVKIYGVLTWLPLSLLIQGFGYLIAFKVSKLA